ncbi:hypothetical protein ECG_05526 [Echinococcus granulosus]|uniref:Expressed protein n=1 Tax=Echinococcus granulosus TaxID=6210 RepID=A0A068WL84_ECHGR|nr:hypothetical protein ECG_05526 [Echinococcus granulosus]CDS18429.1 expressed protein [Echinococcus granulosus]
MVADKARNRIIDGHHMPTSTLQIIKNMRPKRTKLFLEPIKCSFKPSPYEFIGVNTLECLLSDRFYDYCQ